MNAPEKPPADRAGIDATLARARAPRFVLDLRRASSPAVHAWLANVQGLGVNGDATIALRPGTAFDVLVHLRALTPARANVP